ncbi:MAG: hypothetical protein M3O70_07345 [Actinomycetota bacterium]|nr:hypothetical protein [Actinomycetota bacterium]
MRAKDEHADNWISLDEAADLQATPRSATRQRPTLQVPGEALSRRSRCVAFDLGRALSRTENRDLFAPVLGMQQALPDRLTGR